MNHIPTAIDHDGRIRLEAYYPGCEDELFEIVHNSRGDINPWMGWCPPDYTLEDTYEWVGSRLPAWELGTDYDYLIKDSQNNEILGSCGLNHIIELHGLANVGYWVRSDRTKQNIATQAVEILADVGFNFMQLTRLEIVAEEKNVASQRVAEKVGAKKEGLLRNRLKIAGQTRDAYMFSLVPDDL